MLTVKWVVQTTKGSVTRIFEAEDVAIAYRNDPIPSLSPTPSVTRQDGSDFKVGRYAVKTALLVINPHDLSADRALDCGLCYVVNDHGKTVGSYQLSNDTIDYAGGFAPTPDPVVSPPGNLQ